MPGKSVQWEPNGLVRAVDRETDVGKGPFAGRNFAIALKDDCKVKLKFCLEQVTKDRRGGRGVAILFLEPRR